MAAKAKKPSIVALNSERESPVLRAAEVVTALLKHTRTVSLTDMFEKVDAEDAAVLSKLAGIALTEEQIELIEANGHHLQYLRNLPTVSLAECPECGAVAAVIAVANSCTLKLSCPGKPVKSGVAKKVPVADESEPRP